MPAAPVFADDAVELVFLGDRLARTLVVAGARPLGVRCVPARAPRPIVARRRRDCGRLAINPIVRNAIAEGELGRSQACAHRS
jgi:hypothetical protein